MATIAGLAMELGIYTFAEMSPDPKTGRRIDPAECFRNLMEEVELTDQVGSMSSASASITGLISQYPPRRWRSRPRPHGRRISD